MPFETKVPPVPTRQEELEYITKLEKNFLSQPELKYYMNESLRELKLEDSYKLNYVKRNWWFHFSVGALITGVFIFPVGRIFHRYRSGVPHFFRHKQYFVDFDHYLQGRNTKALLYQLPLWLIMSSGYAYYFTDHGVIDDEYFERVKVKDMFKSG